MSNPDLIKSMVAGAAITNFRIVKPHSTATQVVMAAAATDKLMGVVDAPGGVASGVRVDVVLAGIANIEAGGTIAEGDPITSDSVGRSVTAAPSAGVNNRIIGFAVDAAVIGDIHRVLLSPCVMQG